MRNQCFNGSCLSNWPDSSCPDCRYSQAAGNLWAGFLPAGGTRKDVPEGIGRRKGIAIYLSLKQSVFGIMLATNMLTVVRARMIVEAVNILTVEWLMLSLTENWTR
nr:hypothetical protein At1g29480 [Arabidopsis thaliana]